MDILWTVATEPAAGWVPADTLASRLVLLRHGLGLSQREAAERCGLGAAAWNLWEHGSMPRNLANVVMAISGTLGCDRDWLMWGGPLGAPVGPTELPRHDSNVQPAG